MRLGQLRRDWNDLAKEDPFWAALTESGKRGNRWSVSEFFSTGVAEVDRDMARIRELVPAMSRGAALDFGCGPGRLTVALARHFARATGVDISKTMVDLARAHCAEPQVDFVCSTRPNLKVFPDGSFDFVYSRITLQHIAPKFTKLYLREFVRVLSPGGVLSVQVPVAVHVGDPPDRLKFSIWPPTMVMRIKRHLRYHHPGWYGLAPKIHMYALPASEVLECLEAAGATLLQCEQTGHDDALNVTYVARKRGGP
jgi:ubiquinone/menaquinone biosynthesis C-methylase UbiE